MVGLENPVHSLPKFKGLRSVMVIYFIENTKGEKLN